MRTHLHRKPLQHPYGRDRQKGRDPRSNEGVRPTSLSMPPSRKRPTWWTSSSWTPCPPPNLWHGVGRSTSSTRTMQWLKPPFYTNYSSRNDTCFTTILLCCNTTHCLSEFWQKVSGYILQIKIDLKKVLTKIYSTTSPLIFICYTF